MFSDPALSRNSIMLPTSTFHPHTCAFWRLCLVLIFTLGLISLPPHQADAATVQPQLWVTNGPIDTLTIADDKIYIGGTFSYVGLSTGNLAAIDSSSGAPDTSFPRVAGQVLAIAPDGSGGWFIGGSFTAIGGIPRQNLAHIRADKTLDPAWNPGVSGDSQSSRPPGVFTLQVSNNTVYIGGNFTSAGGQPRNYLAALDATTGAPKAWNPNPDIWVYSMALSGSTLYISGLFTSVAGQSRNYLAAIDATTGALTSWNPNANSPVNVVAVHNNIIYAGGSFSTVGGASRNNLASLDPTTGQATSWTPNPDAGVLALAFAGNSLYVAGYFAAVGGQSRNYIAALDITSGVPTPWNPNASNIVQSLAISGGIVYIGGGFSTVGGQKRNNLAAIDAGSGAVTSWNPNPDNAVRALAVSGSTIYAGGDFGLVGGVNRSNLAALDRATGKATDWSPSVSGNIYAMTILNNRLYVGGLISSIDGQTRGNLASFDIGTGKLTDWKPTTTASITSRVWALATSGDLLYIGGDFATVAGQPRDNLAAFNTSTGMLASWNPGTSGVVLGTVYTLAAQASTVYAGGLFNAVGGQSRKGIAAIDGSSGSVTSWDAHLLGQVNAIALGDTAVYVGGSFSSINGQPRAGLVALDAASGLVLPALAPDTSGSVTELVARGGELYIGGFFNAVGGLPRTNVASIDTASGAISPLNPDLNGGVTALTFDTGTLYLGGQFTRIDTQAQPYLGGISVATAATTYRATNISATHATLNGLVNANGTNTAISFELTTASGDYSAAQVLIAAPAQASDIMPIWVSAFASGLKPSTTYYYRVVAKTASGDFVGTEQEMRTPAVTYVPLMLR
jgi:trimeric autotransporter adhesin